MRHIGTLPDARQAEVFQDYALTLGMKTRVEQEPTGWAVWVFDEDQVERARNELEKYAASPGDAVYREASEAASHLRDLESKKAELARKNTVNVRERWQRPMASRAPVTFTLMAASIFVAVTTQLGDQYEPVMRELVIAPYESSGGYIRWNHLEAVREGQVYRLVTPIFIHHDWLHILFNMLMLIQLGVVVETRRGSWRFLLMVLAIAVLSNLGQYFWAGPGFGGMSGVIYGLFGYLWMKSRFDPASGFYMPQNVVFWLIGWFFLGVFSIIPNVANAAHGVGLVTGMVMGYVPTLWRR